MSKTFFITGDQAPDKLKVIKMLFYLLEKTHAVEFFYNELHGVMIFRYPAEQVDKISPKVTDIIDPTRLKPLLKDSVLVAYGEPFENKEIVKLYDAEIVQVGTPVAQRIEAGSKFENFGLAIKYIHEQIIKTFKPIIDDQRIRETNQTTEQP